MFVCVMCDMFVCDMCVCVCFDGNETWMPLFYLDTLLLIKNSIRMCRQHYMYTFTVPSDRLLPSLLIFLDVGGVDVFDVNVQRMSVYVRDYCDCVHRIYPVTIAAYLPLGHIGAIKYASCSYI